MAGPRVLLIYPNFNIPFVFRELERAGAEVTVIHSAATAFPEGRYAVAHHHAVDIYGDPEGSLDFLTALHERERFDAVYPIHEPGVLFSARLAQRIGLRGLDPDVAILARDKSRMRAAFRDAGLNVPAFQRLAGSVDRLPEGLRFPVVVKPTSGFSSQGVVKADDETQFADAIARVAEINLETLDRLSQGHTGRFSGILVEEYIDGIEYAAECFSQNGDVFILSLAEKGRLPGPYFEEKTYIVPARLSGALLERTLHQIRSAVQALHIGNGPSHVEFRIRDDQPYIIEIGARLGGSGLAPFFVEASSGNRLAKLVLDNLLGGADTSAVDPNPAPIASSAVYIVATQGSGELLEIEGLEAARNHPATQHVLQFLFPGDVIPAFPKFSGYPAFVLSRHATYEEADRFHDWLDATIRMRYAATV